MEEDKGFLEYLRKVSPGTSLRTVIDDLVDSNLGALIVIETKETQSCIEGGFRVNCRFTPQRLFELCKMDGAIVLSQDMKRILYANALLIPNNTINTNETGTRHKAAEKTAKQLGTFVIAISERKKKTTLYYKNLRYLLKSSDELLRDISSSLQNLEKQKEIFNELNNRLNILEISGMASVREVCSVVQRAEMISRISEGIKRSFVEIGKVGGMMNMRYKELIRGVEKIEENLLRDYSKLSLKKSKTLLENISYDGLLELDVIARLVFDRGLEDLAYPRGYRFLSHLTLNQREVSLIVRSFKNLNEILDDDSGKFEQVLKNRATTIKEEIEHLRDQVLEGKVVF